MGWNSLQYCCNWIRAAMNVWAHSTCFGSLKRRQTIISEVRDVFIIVDYSGKLGKKSNDSKSELDKSVAMVGSPATSQLSLFLEYLFPRKSGSVYTNTVSFVTASISMRLHLPFTWAFSKRSGFICRVYSETASIWMRLILGAKFALFDSK